MGVGTGEGEGPRPLLAQPPRAAHRPGVGSAVRLVEEHIGSVLDRPLQADRVTGQHAGCHRCPAGVRVRSGEGHGSRSEFDERAGGAGDHAGESRVGIACSDREGRSADHHRSIARQRSKRVVVSGKVEDRAGSHRGGGLEAEGVRGTRPQRAVGDDCRPGVGIDRRQRRGTRSRLHQRAVAGDDAGEAQGAGLREDERGLVEEIPLEGSTVDEAQGAFMDGGQTRVGVGCREGDGARPPLLHDAGSGDDARELGVVGAVEEKRATVGDIARNPAGRAVGAELKDAVIDRREARVGVVRGQHEGACTLLDQPTRAGDEAGENDAIRAVVDRSVGGQRDGIGHRHIRSHAQHRGSGAKSERAGAESRRIAEDEASVIEQRAAGEAVRTG